MQINASKPKLGKLLRSLPPASSEVRREQIVTAVANVALLVLALWLGWTFAALIWPYWIQSVAIGAFNAHRMSQLRRFSTDGLKINGKPVPATDRSKNRVTAFFCLHYGLFHLVYLVFLFAKAPSAAGEWPWIVGGGLAFVIIQAFAHRRVLAEDAQGCPNLGHMMFLPYLRILPIHLTILLGAPLSGAGGGRLWSIVLFGGLKSLADHWSIRAEDAVARRNRKAGAAAAAERPDG